MKIGNRSLDLTFMEYLAVPGTDIVFHIKPLTKSDREEFDRICPRPVPQKRVYADGRVEDAKDDKSYEDALTAYSEARLSYMIVKGLLATPGLEFETVNIADPSTYRNWESELEKAGFSELIINLIVNKTMVVNQLSEAKIKEATDAFLAGKAAAQS
jgi:hypothetical protein